MHGEAYSIFCLFSCQRIALCTRCFQVTRISVTKDPGPTINRPGAFLLMNSAESRDTIYPAFQNRQLLDYQDNIC